MTISPGILPATANPRELISTRGSAGAMTSVSGTSSKKKFQPGQTVHKILKVCLQTSAGKLWPGVSVRFEVTSGGGFITNGMQVTDRLGAAALPRDSWTLGPIPGLQTVTATALEAGITHNPHLYRRIVLQEMQGSIIRIISGDGQSGPVNSSLPDQLLVEVLADDGISPVAGAQVSWKVTGSNDAPLVLATDNLGHSAIIITTGGTPGSYSATATLENGNVATFRFTVTP